MITFYRPKGKASGVTPKQKKTKKNSSPIIIRDMSKSNKSPSVTVTKASENVNIKLNIINDCISSKSILEFIYVDKQGIEQTRNVEPQKVTKLNGELALYAFCIQNEGLRIFILNNMRNLKKIEVSRGQSE